MNVKNALYEGKLFLKNANVEQYALDTELFLMKATGFTKVQLFTKDDYILTEEQENFFLDMLKKRAEKIPTQYLLGKCVFMGLDFFVDENVLIPRPDTEILVEAAIDWAKENKASYFLDMCTGSGCIALSIAHYAKINGVAVDISKEALCVADKNAKALNLKSNINFIQSDLFENVSDFKFDFITSNPPYIISEQINGLMDEVRLYEPKKALDGGEDGLDFYRKIALDAKNFIKDNGAIFFEIGYNQGHDVKCILENNNYKNIHILKDLSGLDRVVWGIKN